MRRALAGAALGAALLRAGAAQADDSDEEMGRRLQEALRRRGGSVHRCYGAALDRDRLAEGEILFQVEVGEGGKVRRAEVLKDQSSAPGLGSCLVGEIGGWTLPELQAAPGDRVVFPLVFRRDLRPPPPIVIPELSARRAGEGERGSGGKGGARKGDKGPAAPAPLVYVSEASHPGTQATLRLLPAQPAAPPLRAAAADTVLFVLAGQGRLLGPAGLSTELGPGDGVLVPPGARFALGGALRAVELARLPEATPAAPAAPRGPGAPAAAAAAPSPLIVRGAALTGLRILGGKGQVKILVDQGAAGAAGLGAAAPGLSLEELSCEAGVEIPVHVHESSDELLYIASGRGVMSAGQERDLRVGPGDAVRIPRGVPHGLLVRERLVAVQSYAPAGPEQRFRAPPPRTDAPRNVPETVLDRKP